MVLGGGLEPPRVAPQAPQACVYANFTTRARLKKTINNNNSFATKMQEKFFNLTRNVDANGILQLNRNRDEVLRIFEENVYGVRPDFEGFVPRAKVVREERMPEGAMLRKQIAINTPTPLGETTFTATAYFPEGGAEVPVFVMPSFNEKNPGEFENAWRGGMSRWPVNEIVARGCATVAFNYNDVLTDDAHVFDGVNRSPNGWGAISTWALAASRVMD